jgi:hypothetical protein
MAEVGEERSSAPEALPAPPVRARALVAGTSEAIALVERLVGDLVELYPARSVGEALATMEVPLGMVLCDLRFDDSRMFDFLHAARSSAALSGVPIVCFRMQGARLPARVRRAVELALDGLEVDTFLDLHQLAEEQGAAAAEEALRRLVMQSLPGEAQ